MNKGLKRCALTVIKVNKSLFTKSILAMPLSRRCQVEGGNAETIGGGSERAGLISCTFIVKYNAEAQRNGKCLSALQCYSAACITELMARTAGNLTLLV